MADCIKQHPLVPDVALFRGKGHEKQMNPFMQSINFTGIFVIQLNTSYLSSASIGKHCLMFCISHLLLVTCIPSLLNTYCMKEKRHQLQS